MTSSLLFRKHLARLRILVVLVDLGAVDATVQMRELHAGRGLLESSGCSAVGSCFAAAMIVCDAYGLGCACDGTQENVICNGLPGGYVHKPLRHTGA
ncbi:MAG: hypothetical protein ABSF69_24560 [Polyangiaceae bacterium]|jgi:hypothetical protein